MEEIKQLAEALGTPAGVAAVLAFCVWRISRWAAPRVDVLIDKHTQFVDSTAALQASLNGKVEAVHKDLSIHSLNTSTKLDKIEGTLSSLSASSRIGQS